MDLVYNVAAVAAIVLPVVAYFEARSSTAVAGRTAWALLIVTMSAFVLIGVVGLVTAGKQDPDQADAYIIFALVSGIYAVTYFGYVYGTAKALNNANDQPTRDRLISRRARQIATAAAAALAALGLAFASGREGGPLFDFALVGLSFGLGLVFGRED